MTYVSKSGISIMESIGGILWVFVIWCYIIAWYGYEVKAKPNVDDLFN